jgi:hypothetical protein
MAEVGCLTKDETSIDEEIIQKLMELRTYLGTKIEQLEDEQEKLKTLFKILDEVIVSKSFKKAETASPPRIQESPTKPDYTPTKEVPPQPDEAVVPSGEEVPLRSQTGTLLATIYITETEAQIIPAPAMNLTASTPPFQSFLIGRILDPMKQKDMEAVRLGTLMPDQALEYDTVLEGETIRRIVIRNYGDTRRMREIMTTTRWTLEKMAQKTSATI